MAPPKPALKYQLLFHDAADRLNGNAAILYLDAILMMGPDAKENGAKAIEAYRASDMATFNSLAEKLDMPVVLDELELAGRREICDWDAPFRERGAYTYLPHLEPIAHGLTQLVQVKALRQIEQGKAADALLTLRLGYEMSDKVSRDPTHGFQPRVAGDHVADERRPGAADESTGIAEPLLGTAWLSRAAGDVSTRDGHGTILCRAIDAELVATSDRRRTFGRGMAPAVSRYLANHRRRNRRPPIARRIRIRWKAHRLKPCDGPAKSTLKLTN